MLRKFEVEGFKSFDKKYIFDFTDVRDYAFNTSCIKDNLLKNVIVYGPNSSGKTNLGLAMFDIVAHLTNKNVGSDLYIAYLNGDSNNGYAEFSYEFEFDKTLVSYRYRKDENRNLLYEIVRIGDEKIFEYDYANKQGYLDGFERMAPTLNWRFIDQNESIFKYVMNNTILEDTHPLMRMIRFVNNMLWFRSLDYNRYIGYKTQSLDYYTFIFENDNLEHFQSMLYQANINDELVERISDDGKKRLYVKKNKALFPFFQTASNGTKAFYTFFYWIKTATSISLLFMDEFDAFYHFELSEMIIKMMEQINSQVIVTSHNTSLCTNHIMRPDCYFILNKQGLTSFCNATIRELREGHNLEKLMRAGEFNG